MKEKLTSHLRAMQSHPSIAMQYLQRPNESDTVQYNDPLLEDEHEVIKGLVHKYPNRALIKVSYQCAAHCRFCTRIRQIGDPAGTLSYRDMEEIALYLTAHPEIDDTILSGGDPFYTPRHTMRLLELLMPIESIKVFRIGSRMALQSPSSFYTPLVRQLMEAITTVAKTKPFYILLHVNHPEELTTEVLDVIKMLSALPVTLLSQTVFLKNINDDYNTLYALFSQLYYNRVMPYYLYHCDKVTGLEHFAADRDTELEIATRLRATLSGIACPTYIIDVAGGYGKIPVPLAFMQQYGNKIADFSGMEHTLK